MMLEIQDNHEFHNFYSASYIIGVIKSKTMEWLEHMSCIGG
jgi:hypothetical protein